MPTIPGAGADKDRAYLPHFGRLGQMCLSVTWQRDNFEQRQEYAQQWYSKIYGLFSQSSG